MGQAQKKILKQRITNNVCYSSGKENKNTFLILGIE